MAKAVKRLTVRGMNGLADGMHADGGGLYLNKSNGGHRWVFIWRAGGKRREMGLGSANDIGLPEAREKAAAARAIVAAGGDPIAQRDAERTAAEQARRDAEERTNFGTFATEYIKSVEAGWRNAVHRTQWHNSLRDHAKHIADKPLDEISTDDVLKCLQPIWRDKPETARRVRARIEKVLDAAKVKGHRSMDSINPATWRGHLELLLSKHSKLDRGHHAALGYQDLPAFWIDLGKRPALSARALEFVILTAGRSGEVLGATWGEINLNAKTWSVPAGRMKAAVEHVVPLSDAALTVLDKVKPDNIDPKALVFAVGGAARSNMAMAMLLRRMGRGDLTTHGFRSTFRDWAGDATDFPRDLAEMALAHAVADKTEAAYRRQRAIEKRRVMMDAWAGYVTGEPERAMQFTGFEGALG